MPLTIGARIGPYEVTAAIGAGGMGEVYRARDTKLGRDVAIKVLPDAFAHDHERVGRFKREAQVLAALNHPHIAHVYGVEDAGDVHALVMELVEGPTLDERIGAHGLPVAETIAIARQIAEALAAAHDLGIIHRDLKPANIKVSDDGEVKVLDFGLAKLTGPDDDRAQSGPALSNSPTLTSPAATALGLILGTAAYMAPEQAKGQKVDKRADVWAFGCVLYEMLTGRRAFPGEDVSDTLAAVLKQDPDWAALPADLPPAVWLLLERCLAKDRKRRIADISTALFLMDEGSAAGMRQEVGIATPAPSRWKIHVGLAAAAIVLAIVATALIVRTRWPGGDPAGATPPLKRLSVVLPGGDVIASLNIPSLALSPDGKTLAYAGIHDGRQMLFIRALDGFDAKPLAGTDGGSTPFFSPDGQWIAFWAQGKLKKVTVTGGALVDLCAAAGDRGGSWGPDGTIYFAKSAMAGIWAVSSDGGTPREVTKLDPKNGDISHRWPQVLPGGRAILFTLWTGPGSDEKYVVAQSLSTGERRVLVRGGETGRYVSTGYLVYARDDALLAVPMDLERLKVGTAAPVPLEDFVRGLGGGGEGAHYAISERGDLAYVPGSATRLDRRLAWVDLSGKATPLPDVRTYGDVAISPDGQRAAVQISSGGTVGISILDFATSILTPLATTGGGSQFPIWTYGGEHVVYRGTRLGFRNLYSRPWTGGEEERLTTKAGTLQTANATSSDGTLAFDELSEDARERIWILPPGKDRTPEPLRTSPESERDARFSPDGRWLAYQSTRSGRNEVWVQAYPGPGAGKIVSTSGGAHPVWSRARPELYYSERDRMMAVTVTGSGFSLPRALFSDSQYLSSIYDVDKDGRFLMIQPVQPDAPANEVRVVINWAQQLGRVVPGAPAK